MKEITENKRKKEALKQVVCMLEQTANNLFDVRDKEWNLLLSFRDKLKKHIEKKYLL